MMMSGKVFLKSHILSWRRKVYSDWEDVTSSGWAFQWLFLLLLCAVNNCVHLLISVPEPPTPILPPVGVKAPVLSPTTIVVMWTDTSLGRRQRVNDNRLYTVKYQLRSGSGSSSAGRRQKMMNTTNLNIHVDDLRPDTEYEFSVKIIKGRRQSAWSLSVFNKTYEMGACCCCCCCCCDSPAALLLSSVDQLKEV